MIYLDNAATTKVFAESRSVIEKYLFEDFYNPSALYGVSLNVRNSIEQARAVIANKLGCQNSELFFTSCATESNNWIFSSGRKYKKGNIVTTTGEHPSVYEPVVALKSAGIDVRFARLTSCGDVDKEDLFKKIDHETALVSIIHCSNETGAINDLNKIVPIIRSLAPKALIHSDGVQAFCKISTNVRTLGLDFYSISGHKVGGPKGIGALYINKNLNLQPFIYGGGQENGLRSGTENTSGIMGFAKAVETFCDKAESQKIEELHNIFVKRLESLDNITINGTAELHSNYIISASVLGIKGEILQHILSDEGILIGLGSACSSKLSQNRVLSSLGRTAKEIEGSIRISFSVDSDFKKSAHASEIICKKIKELRKRING